MNTNNFEEAHCWLQLDLAMDIAYTGHNNEYRRDGITPYIKHPSTVMEKVKKHGKICECVAILHDVCENNPEYTPQVLLNKGLDKEIVDSVTAITKIKGEDYYTDYLPRVKANVYAKIVKIADIICNLNDDPTEKQLWKYSNALVFLLKKD